MGYENRSQQKQKPTKATNNKTNNIEATKERSTQKPQHNPTTKTKE